MSSYKRAYEENKNRITGIIKETKTLVDKLERKSDQQTLEALETALDESEFSIVLVGEFSSGKSTFLNALMGERILPSFTNETTATVNFLRHKEKSQNGEAGRVFYSDGTIDIVDEITTESISKYVSTKSDLDVAHKIDHLDLYLNSRFLEGNVTLVDSPGLNGTADGHREITEEQIRKSSASIFMFRADQPGSKSDFDFLKQLKHRVNKIIFVLNKIDEIKASEGETVESVVESIKKNYKKQFPDEVEMPEVWGVSAYQALVARSNQNITYREREDYSAEEKKNLLEKSRLAEFEERLWKFLTQGEKAREQLISPITRVKSLLEDIREDLSLQQKAMESKQDTSEIEEKIAQVEGEMKDIQDTVKEKEREIMETIASLENEVIDNLKVGINRIKDKQIKELELWDGFTTLEDYEVNIYQFVNGDLTRLVNRLNDEFIEGVQQIIQNKYFNVVSELNNRMKDVRLNIKLDGDYRPSPESFSLGIENMNQEIKRLEKTLTEKEEELQEVNSKVLKARIIEREKEKINDKIERLKEYQRTYELTMPRPQVKKSTVTLQEERKRKGLFGIIGNALKGPEQFAKEKEVIDDSELKEYRRDIERKQRECDNEIAELKEQLGKMDNSLETSEEYNELLSKKQCEVQRMSENMKNMKKEYQEEIHKKYASALKKRKIRLQNYFEDTGDDFERALKKEVRNKKQQIVKMIQSTIAAEFIIKLKKKEKELEKVKEKRESSAAEKERYLVEINEYNVILDSIMKKAIELEYDIKGQEVDKIQTISLNIEGEDTNA